MLFAAALPVHDGAIRGKRLSRGDDLWLEGVSSCRNFVELNSESRSGGDCPTAILEYNRMPYDLIVPFDEAARLLLYDEVRSGDCEMQCRRSTDRS